MSGRVRRPSSKALEAASNMTKKGTGSSRGSVKGKKPQRKSSQTAKVPTNTAQELEDESSFGADIDADDVAFDGPGFDPNSNSLYCVCLGTDDGSPMLQCEGCNNWFHFRCIDLTPAAALNIDSYFCEICTEVGAGMTQLKPPKRAQSGATYDDVDPFEFGQDQPFDEHASDIDYSAPQDQPSTGGYGSESDSSAHAQSQRKRKASEATASTDFYSQGQQQPSKRKKRVRAEGISSDEDEEDEDFDYEATKKRSAPKKESKSRPTAPKPSSATTVKKAGAGAASQAQAAATATRKQCKGTLYKALESVFAPSAGNATNAHARADEYAQQVEDTVFEHFADPGGQPKQKYLSRIRQLLFNLKTSELLRTRVALGQVPAVKFANLSMDELLTPEQRALADSVRARSLKDAVKQDDSSQPRIRTTHKGQELIGEDQSSDATFRVPQPGSAGSPTSPDKAFFEQRQQEELESREGSLAQSPRTTAASPPHQMSPKATSQEAPLSPSASADDQLDDPGSASENRRRSVQFDFDSVWSSVQAQSPPQDTIGASGPQSPMDTSAPAEPDVYDPFDFGKADDAPISTTPPMSPAASSSKAHSGTANPQPTVPTYDPCKTIQEFSTIWSGSVSMPEEGSFPARAVQVGGRPLGQSPVVWQSVIPSKMSMEGRLPTKNASEYLVQCSFAPTREIVVLALLPEQAEGMSAEEAKAKHQYFIDMFTRRDRNGVVPPAQHRRRVVKDCYVVPLRAAEETLPEYIELLDSHALGEKGERKADLLLAVFVLNKGLIPSPHEQTAQGNQPPPSVTSASISGYGSPFPDSTGPLSSAASVTSTHPAAATPAPTLAEPPPAFDPAALSSLMSRAMHFQLNRVLKADCAPTEPSLLASLVASASNAALQSGSTVSSNPPPPIPPYGGSTGNQPYHGPPPTGPALPPYQPPPHADDYYREYPAPYAAREQGHSYSPPRRSGRDAPPFRGRGGGPRGGFQDNGFRGRGRGRGGPPRGRR